MKKLMTMIVLVGLAASAQAGPLFKTAKFAVHAVKKTGQGVFHFVKHL